MLTNSFIQMSKLSNVCGRISYITNEKRQENLYATYTTTDRVFWQNLAKENQQEFKLKSVQGQCIEARELIIALPIEYTRYNPQVVLEDFTDEFRNRYGVECVSAIHHNKTKVNYHIHLIFSERKLLEEPIAKIATRNKLYDKTESLVRTKKEILDENKNIRKGCMVIPKGEIYEQRLFTFKDKYFKSKGFLHEVKTVYTDLINRHISNPKRQLQVFDSNSVYLPTKKIGKNNPRAEEIKADNTARMDWNRTADVALISGIAKTKILEIKKGEIHVKAVSSLNHNGWNPFLFRSIIMKAKEFLQDVIRNFVLSPKPTLNINIEDWQSMQDLMTKLRKQVVPIKEQQALVAELKQQLSETKGVFRDKERKALVQQIQETEQQVDKMLDELQADVKASGYLDAQSFANIYNQSEEVISEYNRVFEKWERENFNLTKALSKKQEVPPEIKNVHKRLRQLGRQTSDSGTKKKYLDHER